MKTIVFLAPFYAPKIGGVERHVERVASILMHRGFKVKVITVSHDPTLPARDVLNGIEVFRITVDDPVTPSNNQVWSWLLRHRKIIAGADLVHCHDKPLWYLPFRFLYPRKPFYMTFHGFERYPLPPKAAFYRRLASHIASGNICIGSYIEKWYGVKADIISYGAVDQFADKDFELNRKVCFTGRLDVDTGIAAYMEALRMLKQDFKVDIELLVCGDGPLRPALEEFAKKHELGVTFFGFVTNPETVIKECSMAFVSGYLAILEAMANKRLVFSIYENPLKHDYLTSLPDSANKFWIADSPLKVAEQLVHLMKCPEIASQKVTESFEWAKKQTWNLFVEQYLSLWKIV